MQALFLPTYTAYPGDYTVFRYTCIRHIYRVHEPYGRGGRPFRSPNLIFALSCRRRVALARVTRVAPRRVKYITAGGRGAATRKVRRDNTTVHRTVYTLYMHVRRTRGDVCARARVYTPRSPRRRVPARRPVAWRRAGRTRISIYNHS